MTDVHIRVGRINNASCRTICGELIHSPQVAEVVRTVLKRHNIPKDLLNLLHSCTMSSANTADDATHMNSMMLPKVAPKTPLLREFHCCQGCWESPRRALHALKDLDL